MCTTKVALKVLKPELAAVVGAERFLAEIETTANLQHPHILPLLLRCAHDLHVLARVHAEQLILVALVRLHGLDSAVQSRQVLAQGARRRP